MPSGLRYKYTPGSACDTLNTGITKVSAAKPLLKTALYASSDAPFHTRYRIDLTLNSIQCAYASDAAKGFGQKLWTFQAAYIVPLFAYVSFTLTTATGLATTAGELALGTTVASGAVAVTSGTAAFEDLFTGQTLTGNADGTTVTDTFADAPWADAASDNALDGHTTAKALHLNWATTADQTAAESATITARVVFDWFQLVP